ncbi:hypothetical protein L7F22_053281 [Adiantum nelumboides]|nr:hypothetical protein [Adiantum nelumboides]
MKDDTSSELCDVNIDLSSRKSARKRKATSKLLEFLKKKEKVLRVSKNKNKKELPRESRESTIQSSSLETKARDLCLGDKEAILMKWLGTKRVEDIYPLIKPTYIALKKTHSFFKRKMCDTNSSTMCEDLVAWLLIENIVCINFDKVGPLSLKDVELTNEE